MTESGAVAVGGPRVADRRPRFGAFLQVQELSIAMIGVALAIYFVASSSSFATKDNAVTLSQYVAPIVLFAISEVFILILGEIDLSVGEVYVLTPFVVRFVADAGGGVIFGIIVSLAIAAIVGFVNGVVTVKLRVPSFITTLETCLLSKASFFSARTGPRSRLGGARPWR